MEGHFIVSLFFIGKLTRHISLKSGRVKLPKETSLKVQLVRLFHYKEIKSSIIKPNDCFFDVKNYKVTMIKLPIIILIYL